MPGNHFLILKRLQRDMYVIFDNSRFTSDNVRDKSLIFGIYVYKKYTIYIFLDVYVNIVWLCLSSVTLFTFYTHTHALKIFQN